MDSYTPVRLAQRSETAEVQCIYEVALLNGERSYESPLAVMPMTVIMKLRGDCAGWLPGYSHKGEIYMENYLFNYYLFHKWGNLWN